jgi:hypothetical protein
VERLVRWAEDLATRGGKKAVDPKMGSWKMEVRKFGRSYSELLDVMMEHAQMEERILFPIFDRADRGTQHNSTKQFPFVHGILTLDLGSVWPILFLSLCYFIINYLEKFIIIHTN